MPTSLRLSIDVRSKKIVLPINYKVVNSHIKSTSNHTYRQVLIQKQHELFRDNNNENLDSILNTLSLLKTETIKNSPTHIKCSPNLQVVSTFPVLVSE